MEKVDYRNTKIMIKSPEHSKAFQEMIFGLGGMWRVGGVVATKLEEDYIYVNSHLIMTSGGYGYYFEHHAYTEVFLNMPTTKAHPHAHNMYLYSQDALKTDRPWELWDAKYGDGEWFPIAGQPKWSIGAKYRHKPTKKLFNGVELSMHVTEPLDNDIIYHVPSPLNDFGFQSFIWRGNDLDLRLMCNGVVYLDSKDAIKHSGALKKWEVVK